MDCDDAMLVLATRTQRALSAGEASSFHGHLDDCEACRALAADDATDWRWLARIPQDAFDSDPVAMVLPTVDPIVFDIDQEIAAGGMGRITKATDRRLGREVALKEVLSLDMRARFEREALITARLQHPAIVPIYEAGTFPNGHPFYTMRLVWGGTLGNAIHLTKTIEQRLRLLPHVIAVTDALAYAHSNRIIHRDLKPGNVLVGEFGETVVIDWGLAKDLATSIDALSISGGARPSSPKLTRVGSVLGTPGFMAPEQAAGGPIDERADVYALGAILYNLLAGQPPYWDKHQHEGSTQLIAIGIAEPPTPLAELAPDAPADLRAIAERAMARRKEDRYPTAKEMADELRRFAAGQLIQREYTLRELAMRWIKKHRTAVAVGAIASAVLLVVAIVAFVGITRSRGAERTAREAAERAEVSAKDEATNAKRTAAALQIDQGVRELLDGDGSRALAYLAAAYTDEPDPEAPLHYLLTAAAHDLDLQLGPPAPPAKAVAFAGEQLIGFDGRGLVSYDGTLAAPAIHPDQVIEARFDRTGRALALHRTTPLGALRVEVWDVASRQRRVEIDDLEGARVVFDRSGMRTASFADTRLLVHELGTAGAPLAAPSLDARAGTRIVDVAIDAEYVATCGDEGVRVWSLARPGQPSMLHPTDCTLIAFLEPGWLAIANRRYQLLRWRIGAPGPDKTMSGHIPINVIAVSEPTRRIATGDATGVVMWSWDGTALGESRDITGGIDKLAFTEDGTAFVGAGAADRLFVWDTASFHLRQVFGGGERRGTLHGFAISPQGTIAAVSDKELQRWRLPAGRLITRAPSTGFVVAGDHWVTATARELVVHSLVDADAEPRTLAHDLGANVELRASGAHVVVQNATHRALFDPGKRDPIVPRALPAATTLGAGPSADVRFALHHDGTRITIRDAVSGEPIPGDGFPAERARHAVLSSDGRRLAILWDTHVEQYEVASGARLGMAKLPDRPGNTYDARYAPTGDRLVLFGPYLETLIIEGGSVAPLANATSAYGVAFSAGTRIALGVGNTVQLWDLAQPDAPRFVVSSVIRHAFALDAEGTLLATGAIDGSIRISDLRGRMIDRLVGSQTSIERLAFARGDDRLIGQSADGHALVWDVHVDKLSTAQVRDLARTRCEWKLEGGRLAASRPR